MGGGEPHFSEAARCRRESWNERPHAVAAGCFQPVDRVEEIDMGRGWCYSNVEFAHLVNEKPNESVFTISIISSQLRILLAVVVVDRCHRCRFSNIYVDENLFAKNNHLSGLKKKARGVHMELRQRH